MRGPRHGARAPARPHLPFERSSTRTTVNAFDSARQPYTLEVGERFNSPYDFYAWRNGQPFTFLAVVNPGEDPAVDDCRSMFRIQFPDGQTVLARPQEIDRHLA